MYKRNAVTSPALEGMQGHVGTFRYIYGVYAENVMLIHLGSCDVDDETGWKLAIFELINGRKWVCVDDGIQNFKKSSHHAQSWGG